MVGCSNTSTPGIATDASAVAAFMAEDASYEDLALGVMNEGREAIKAFVAEAENFSNDYRFILVSEQVNGDRYAIEWEMVGTNTGESGGTPATNKPFRMRGASIGRLDSNNKIQENRDYWTMTVTQVGTH